MSQNSPFIVHKSSGMTEDDTSHKSLDIDARKAPEDIGTIEEKEAIVKHQFEAEALETDPSSPHPFATVKPESAKKAGTKFLLCLFLLPILGVLSALFLVLYVEKAAFLAEQYSLILFVVFGAMLLMSLARAVRYYKVYEQDQKLLKELFDGSPSARLVTDINNKTVYTNIKFADVCKQYNVEETGIEALNSLFSCETNAEQTQKLKQFIEKARKGQGESIELVVCIPQEKDNLDALNQDIEQASILKQAGNLEDKNLPVEDWYQLAAQPVAGRAGFVQWRLEDVTRRHNVEALIREERGKLLDFMDNAPVGFFSVDENGQFTFANATLARWLGEDIETLYKKGRLHSFIDNPPLESNPYDISIDGGAKQVAELNMKGLGGKTFLASISQTVVHEEENKARTRAVVHDLTSERAMHQALKDSEDRFQKFFEEAPLGIALVNQHGVMNDCNPSFAHMLDVPVQALEGCEFSTLINVENRNAVMQSINSIEEGQGIAAPVEFKLMTKDKEVYVQMYARKFHGKNIVLHFIDLTDQKTLEAQFVQSQKMQAIGQLAGGVAHDFNNLLTAMIGFCDLLILRHKAGDPSFNDIMQIKQNANRAANLVRQLLAFSRQQTLQPRLLDITETLTELSHLLRRLLGVGIELDVRHDSDVGFVKADEGQLEQVMINLAVNARDAMDGQGALVIKSYRMSNPNAMKRGADTMPAGDWVVIDVKDTGCGIEKAVLERIFEPFFTTKAIGSGTGLGLSTVYGITRQTGGYIHVESILGEGTRFLIYLPEHEADEKEQKAEQEKEPVVEKDLTGTALILLVEDEDAVRGFAARALKNKGYEVLEAACAEDALDLMKNDKPDLDLMITDVIMPEMDGPTLAREILSDHPKLPIIFVSGYTEDRFKDEFSGYDVSFLPKPFTLQQLAERVKDTLVSSDSED